MQSGYYSAAAGMVTQFNRIDVIANNLANTNTIGFKEDNLVIGDFMRLYKNAQDKLPNPNNTKEAAQFLNRALTKTPQIVDAYTDQSVGVMQQSDNQLDLALSKEGLFFLVKTPDGIRMTRDGSFTTDNDGKLVTKDGYEVLPSDYFESKRPIIIPVQSSTVEIEKSGQISTNIVGSAKLAPLAKLFIFQPDNVDMIKKDASNLYRYDNQEQQFTNAQNMEAVSQGFVEKSNVNPIKMMSALIETHRLVEMYQKAMDSQMNDMNRDAIEKLAKRS